MDAVGGPNGLSPRPAGRCGGPDHGRDTGHRPAGREDREAAVEVGRETKYGPDCCLGGINEVR